MKAKEINKQSSQCYLVKKMWQGTSLNKQKLCVQTGGGSDVVVKINPNIL